MAILTWIINEVKFDDKGYIEIADQTMKRAHEVEVDDKGTMNVERKGKVVGTILFSHVKPNL